jgi:two-component system, NtrC family, response regulator GlrR
MSESSQSCLRTRDADRVPRGSPAPPDYSLRVLGGNRHLSVVGPATCSVGTARDNTLVLEDPYVSKHHCLLLRRERELWIEDRESRNGTWVNSVRVHRCQLQEGARIALGRTLLHLVRDGQAEPAFGIVGRSAAICRVLEQAVRLGVSDQPVLITGETGTGKELVARALHECSPSRLGPFEAINCAAIPRELAEAELFGHTQGAFTGATRERRGAFERASGGTLFLDEIGEMPLELQPKLLRVLEEREVQRLGDEERRPVRFRLLAATHRDLLAEAERGRFRIDLFHRIAVGLLELPPLRERPEDIPLLVRHFLRLEVDDEAMALLQQHPWRGNVRELRNTLQRAALTVAQQGCLRGADLRQVLQPAPAGGGAGAEPGLVKCLGRRFDEIRRDIYQLNLRAAGGSRTAAAAALGIPKSTFFDQIREMELASRTP